TGCDSGFGHALVQHLDSLGFTVFAGVLNERGVGADKLRRCGSERLSVLQLDVTDSAQIQTAYLRVNADVGETGLWGIVNNAGFLGCVADGEILPMKLYRKCMAVNFLGAVELTQTFLPLIRRARGRMVNISSFAGEVPIPGFAAYGASKAALSMFSEAMRQELSRWGIKVAIVQPSGFKTNIRGQKKEWESCKEEILSQLPQDVKEDYGEGYISSILGHFFQIMSVSQEDLRPVMDDIYQALMAASPQTLYTPGQLAWIIPFMHRFFPVRFSDFVIATLFGFYKHVPARLQGTSSPVNKRTG
ncbi:DHB2 dehydrogenase, partial [Amia calva]|nr:DHB2 dehydrogenase [Amia calva]